MFFKLTQPIFDGQTYTGEYIINSDKVASIAYNAAHISIMYDNGKVDTFQVNTKNIAAISSAWNIA